MANLIQIKRSTGTDAPASGGLVTGELAYSLLSTSNSLFVGDGSNNAIRIGGGKYLWLHQANVAQPGALTANAVVITNGNSYVTAFKTNNLMVGTDGQTVNISSISITANSTQLGATAGGSNTELVSSWAIKAYVDGVASASIPVLTNTRIGYGNTSNYLGGSASFTFDDTTAKVTIGDGTTNTTISNTGIITGTLRTSGLANLSSANVITTLNVAGKTSLANVDLGSSASDNVRVVARLSSNIIPYDTNTYLLGNSSFYWAGGYFQDLAVSRDLTVSGNLTVSGTLTTINTTNLNVQDPLIRVANGNLTTDTVDVGIYGSFGNATAVQYTGLFRDQSDGGTYKLFSGYIPEPTTTVDTANANFQIATLQSYLKSGGIVSNSTTVALTANSTINVAIVANTLSLSTALPGTSGGTGLASYTAEQILVANSSNGFRALGAGAEGTVLQIASGVVAYQSLDGGTF